MENLTDLASIKIQVKDLGLLQDKLGKQDFFEHMKKEFELVPETVKQTVQKTVGVVKGTTKAAEINGEKTYKTIDKIRDILKDVTSLTCDYWNFPVTSLNLKISTNFDFG